jgi:hypothetical protein
MTQHHSHRPRHLEQDLHPSVYKVAAGLILWYAFAAWLMFAAAGYQKFDLIMVSGVMLAAVGIPLVVFFTRRRFLKTHMHVEDAAPHPLRTWLANDFDTWQARLSAREAAVQILLPLAAVSVGITLLGIAMIADMATLGA